MRKATTAKSRRRGSRPAAKKSPARSSSKPPAVFIVDDEPLLLDLAEVSLKPAGVVIRKFQDPAAAWQAFQRARPKPRLIVSDYAMGKMNGLELLARCKHAHPSLKTILISGTAGAEIIVNAPVKVDHFLSKPYPPERLCALAHDLLEGPDNGE